MNINAIDVRQLRYFLAVAEELHFGRAARKLNISQPPLSQQIKALEIELSVRLFERTQRRVTLTTAGQYLLPHAQALVRDFRHFGHLARDAQAGLTGHIRLGFNYSAPFHPMTTKLLQRFHAAHPNIKIDIVLHEQDNILQLADLDAPQLDAALIWLDDDYHSTRLAQLDLAADPLQVVLPRTHPLANRKRISINALKELPLIAQPRHAGTQRYDAIFRAYASIGAEPKIVYEALQIPLVMSMVAAGQGFSLLPSFLSALPVADLIFLPLQLPRGKVPCMTYRLVMPKRQKNPAAALFFKTAEQLVKATK